MIYKDSPDDLRTKRQKVYAAFAANAARSNQLEVCLIGQRGRLPRLAGLMAPQVLPGDSPQLRVNDRHHAAKRSFIAIAPGGDQLADVCGMFDGHRWRSYQKNSGPDDTFCSRFPEYSQEVFQP
jgi:hypothetical protein